MTLLQYDTKDVKTKPSIKMEELIALADKAAKKDIKREARDYNEFDPLAEIIRDKYRIARNNRANEFVGGKSIDTLLNEADEQYHSIVPCGGCESMELPTPDGVITVGKLDTAELRQIEKFGGINVKASMTKDFVDVVTAMLFDSYMGESKVIEYYGTPIPMLPEDFMAALKEEMLQAIMTEEKIDTAQPITDLFRIKEMQRDKLLKHMQDYADEVAANHTTLTHDQMVQGGFMSEFSRFIFNFALYPYAVMTGPTPEMGEDVSWDGDTLKTTHKPIMKFKNIHPRNYFWSPDTREAGTGEYDIIVDSISRHDLIKYSEMAKGTKNGFIESAINIILRDTAELTHTSTGSSGHTPYTDWFMRDGESSDKDTKYFDDTNRCTLVKFFGSFLGKDLWNLNSDEFEDVRMEEYYDIEAWVCAGRTIWVGEAVNTVTRRRPIYSANFQEVQSGIAGYGLAAVLGDLERCRTMLFRAIMLHATYLAGPLGEYDADRLDDSVDDLPTLEPLTLTRVSSGYGANASTVVRFWNVQNNMVQLVNMMENLRNEAHRRTGISPSVYGEIQGSADRNYKGLTARLAQGMKIIKRSATAIEQRVVVPMGRYMYWMNVLHADEFEDYGELRGDCFPVVNGAVGQIEREVAKSEALEMLQVIGQTIPALQNNTDYDTQRLLTDAVLETLESLGINIAKYERTEEEKLAQQQMQQQAIAQQMAAQQPQQGAAPNPQAIAQGEGLPGVEQGTPPAAML